MVQRFIGGGRAGKGGGFDWSRRPMDDEEVAALHEVAEQVAARLRAEVGEPEVVAVTTDTPDEPEDVAELRAEVARLRTIVRRYRRAMRHPVIAQALAR